MTPSTDPHYDGDATADADPDPDPDPDAGSDPDRGSDPERDPDPDPDVDLDETDRQLVDALIADGRASAADLSAAAGVATATATKRLRRLEESAVLEGYRPVIDYEELGLDVTAVFEVEVDGDGPESVVAALQDTGRMIGVYEVTGSDDVVAVGKFADAAQLNAQVRALSTDPHVRATSTHVVLDVVRECEQFPVCDGE